MLERDERVSRLPVTLVRPGEYWPGGRGPVRDLSAELSNLGIVTHLPRKVIWRGSLYAFPFDIGWLNKASCLKTPPLSHAVMLSNG